MKLCEIRKLPTRSRLSYINDLQSRGKIKRYITKDGYVAYDEDEFEAYKKTAKAGRPRKRGGGNGQRNTRAD